MDIGTGVCILHYTTGIVNLTSEKEHDEARRNNEKKNKQQAEKDLFYRAHHPQQQLIIMNAKTLLFALYLDLFFFT